MSADAIQHAIDRTASEFSSSTHFTNGFHYIWNDKHKGTDIFGNGIKYLREGVAVFMEDNVVVVRAVTDNGLNAGEAKLTGFAAVSIELIAGAIETALEFI